MADEILRVPRHGDDRPGNINPVTQKDYNMNHSVSMSFTFGREYTNFNWAIGFEWMIFPWVNLTKAEQNYYGPPGSEERGVGQALTYVGLRQAGVIPTTSEPILDIFLNLTPKAKVEFAPFGGPLKDVWIGASVSYYTISAQTGWDRYDSLESNKDYALAHVFPIRTYFMIPTEEKDGDLAGFMFGIQFQPGSETGLGRRSEVEWSRVTGFFGFGGRM
jgi:hypothetical protein